MPTKCAAGPMARAGQVAVHTRTRRNKFLIFLKVSTSHSLYTTKFNTSRLQAVAFDLSPCWLDLLSSHIGGTLP